MFLLFVCSKCREEADRLIGILRSSVVDNGVDVKKAAAAAASTHEVKPCTPNTLHRTRSPANGAQHSNGVLSDAQRWREELTKNRQEQKFKFWPVGFDSENHASPAVGGSEVYNLSLSHPQGTTMKRSFHSFLTWFVILNKSCRLSCRSALLDFFCVKS